MNYDVVIIGGSLSGAASATLLLRESPDLKVLIVERAPQFCRRVGEARVDLEIAYDDAPERLGFNPVFILDALKVMDPARPVRFEFTNPKAPGKLIDGVGYVYVVMPVSVAEGA